MSGKNGKEDDRNRISKYDPKSLIVFDTGWLDEGSGEISFKDFQEMMKGKHLPSNRGIDDAGEERQTG